jgi:hypothetical protein
VKESGGSETEGHGTPQLFRTRRPGLITKLATYLSLPSLLQTYINMCEILFEKLYLSLTKRGNSLYYSLSRSATRSCIELKATSAGTFHDCCNDQDSGERNAL